VPVAGPGPVARPSNPCLPADALEPPGGRAGRSSRPALGYNVLAIPIAAGVLVPWGIDLPMAAGAIAMSASTIIVAANAQLLKRLRLRRSGGDVAQVEGA
jgi:hypothetical protein